MSSACCRLALTEHTNTPVRLTLLMHRSLPSTRHKLNLVM